MLGMEALAVETRVAQAADAAAVAAVLAEGFDGYREWAPPGCQPRSLTPAGVNGIC
jgi:hypothetical protein